MKKSVSDRDCTVRRRQEVRGENKEEEPNRI